MNGTPTNFPNGITSYGVPTMGIAGAPLFTGNWYFVDYVNGSDGYPGTAEQPLKTIYAAYAKMTSGNNDVCVIVGNGAASGSQRLSKALAQAVDSSATTGTLTWAKNACHLIGMTAPTATAQRARIAPPTGTYTQATFGSGNFVVVTGAGCMFSNFSVFHGFSTGGNNQIAWTDSGGRNYYHNVDFGGAGDAASAQSTSSRSLLISGAGENTFVGCTFGLDTVTRTVANATVQLAGATARNVFIDCHWRFQTSAATALGILGTGAGCIDRDTNFVNCRFVNQVQSTSTTMDALATLPASAGGLLLMKNCTMVGITEFGTDATTRGQVYVDGAAPTAATSGIAVNPA